MVKGREKKEGKWSKIKGWEEWLRLWRTNFDGNLTGNGRPNLTLAISLLHVGGNIYDLSEEQKAARIRFYIDLASQFAGLIRAEEEKEDEVAIAKKAYQILAKDLLPYWLDRQPSAREIMYRGFREKKKGNFQKIEAETILEVIKFFANKIYPIDEGKQYTKKAHDFISDLKFGKFDLSNETEKVLKQKEIREDLIKAFINLEDFGQVLMFATFPIRDEGDSDLVISALKEILAIKCWDLKGDYREIDLEKEFPEGREVWKKSLEDPNSKAFKYAFIDEEDTAICLFKAYIDREKIPFLEHSVHWRMSDREVDEFRSLGLDE